MMSSFTGLLEFNFTREPYLKVLHEIAGELLSVCNYAIQNYDKFALDSEVYGDVRGRLMKLAEKFSNKYMKEKIANE